MAALRNIKIMIKFLILTFLIIFAAVFMSGCGDTEAKVENFMKIADDFVILNRTERNNKNTPVMSFQNLTSA